MATAGKLIGIATRARSRAPMMEVDQIDITADAGLAGDFRGKPGARQVTVLSAEDWQAACEALGLELPWTTRRANLLVSGVQLPKTAGALLRIGPVTLRVSCETDPCSRMEEAAPGLREALTPGWRGGVCCRVVAGGAVQVGAEVTLEAVARGPLGGAED